MPFCLLFEKCYLKNKNKFKSANFFSLILKMKQALLNSKQERFCYLLYVRDV